MSQNQAKAESTIKQIVEEISAKVAPYGTLLHIAGGLGCGLLAIYDPSISIALLLAFVAWEILEFYYLGDNIAKDIAEFSTPFMMAVALSMSIRGRR